MALFVRIVDMGGLAAAAKREGLSPTMVGNYLKDLERSLGATLLTRTTRRQGLTDVGRTYYDHCRTILQLVAQAEAGIEAGQAQPRGRLRIAAPVSFGTERLTPALGRFLRLYPEVSVDVALNDRVVDLVDEGFDAAIRIGDLADSRLIVRDLAPYRMWICAAPAYLDVRGRPTLPQELKRHDCLIFTYAGNQWRLDADGKAAKITVPGRLSLNSGQALRVAALDGLGIIMQPEVLLAEDVAAGRLVRLFADHDLPSRPMRLLYARDRQMPPKLRAFLDFVVDQFGKVRT